MKISRTLLLLPLLTASLALPSSIRAQADQPAKTSPVIMGSRIFDWDKLPATPTALGERRAVCNTPTATLDKFEGHITTLNPGAASHPPHRHAHEELMIIKDGTFEVQINDQKQRVGPGSVLFFASNDLHNLRNVGTTRGTYHVFTFYTPATPKPAAK